MLSISSRGLLLSETSILVHAALLGDSDLFPISLLSKWNIIFSFHKIDI